MSNFRTLESEADNAGTSRRRRTPSKYAESIRELTKVRLASSQINGKTTRREKPSSSNEDDSAANNLSAPDRGNAIPCILPGTNRKISLSVIIKKTPKPKLQKAPSRIVPEKEKPKEPLKNKSLLDTLLEACEQIKEDE